MDKTVLETVCEAAEDWRSDDIKGLLGRCNFKADMLDRKVSLLSGGEKARLAFCKFMVTPSNVLVLDEPTNHLDIPSKEMLEVRSVYYYFLGSLWIQLLLQRDLTFCFGESGSDKRVPRYSHCSLTRPILHQTDC